MRCQKAQRLMNDQPFAAKNEPVNLELAEHLRGCQICAAHLSASDILNRAVSVERTKSPESETPLAFIKTRISAHASQHNQKEHTAMATLKEKIMNHPAMSFGFAGAMLALVLMATIPVSCSRDVGYNMNVGDDTNPIANAITSDADGTASITFQNNTDGTPQAMMLNPQNMIKALKAIGIEDAKLNINANQDGQTITVSGLDSRQQAREALLAIVESSGIDAKVEMTSRAASVEGSILEQAISGIKELVFSSEGKSDEEVKAEITATLEAAGVTGTNVEYMTDADGRKMIFVGAGAGGDSLVTEQAFKWTNDSTGMSSGLPGDSNMTIEMTTDGDKQTVTVEKKITVGGSDK
jgi:hypothetical protein